MPLFAYSASVGAVLLGLLFVAEAQFGPPMPLRLATAFHGLPPPFKAPPSAAREPAHETQQPGMRDTLADAPIMAQAIAAGRPKAAKRRAKNARVATGRVDDSDRFTHTQQRVFGALP